MKRNLKEQKERITELIKLLDDEGNFNPTSDNGSDYRQSIMGGMYNMAYHHVKAVRDSIASGSSDEEFRELFAQAVDDVLSSKSSNEPDVEDNDGPPSYEKNPHETDEYHNKFNKNMTQGFTINEGNAFVGAAKKAKEEGKDSFKLDGKTYKVTIKKSKNKK